MTIADEYCKKLQSLLKNRSRPEWSDDMETISLDELDRLWFAMTEAEIAEVEHRFRTGQLGIDDG